jgi:hypothetical protein
MLAGSCNIFRAGPWGPLPGWATFSRNKVDQRAQRPVHGFRIREIIAHVRRQDDRVLPRLYLSNFRCAIGVMDGNRATGLHGSVMLAARSACEVIFSSHAGTFFWGRLGQSLRHFERTILVELGIVNDQHIGTSRTRPPEAARTGSASNGRLIPCRPNCANAGQILPITRKSLDQSGTLWLY